MASQILAPGITAANATDVTIAAGATGTVALYTELNDNLLLSEGNGGGNLLLDDGFVLLLAQQVGGIAAGETLAILLKDPLGTYGPTGLFLNADVPFVTLGPGIWRVSRPVTTTAIGVQSDA